jgi:hypothetical protein
MDQVIAAAPGLKVVAIDHLESHDLQLEKSSLVQNI